jgi:DeoR family transcriptional regulator, aga operon transcriptional repressor
VATARQRDILQHLNRHQTLEIGRLSELMGLSPSTVRRELTSMEESGLVLRSHGAARLPSPIRYEAPFEERAATMVDAKRKIAARAADMVRPGQVIGLSGGSTSTELSRHLRATQNVTVVTNAVNVALELQAQPSKRVIVTGGVLNPHSYDLVGEMAVQSLKNVHLDVVFQGVSGVDVRFGFTVADEPDVVVARALRAASDRLVILADHTKIGKATFARFCGVDGADLLITDDAIPASRRRELEEAGLVVEVAE